ncbi:metalloregulator ArsR/SmtB family transcription factor [Microbispora sp. NPDC046933]|uniref:ArsR/SmtB family transcription factor n=1 Tax=Microbispora sp. NPDC046933 TaxID=3155618 RepID=UPI0033CC5964
MIRIELAPADLLRVRFAHSPMAEVVASCLALRSRSARLAPASWRARAEPLLRSLTTLHSLVPGPTGYVPDFLTPAPPITRPTLEQELRVVAATPLDQVASEVDRAWAGHGAPPEVERFSTDPAGALAETVREIRRYFTLAIAPSWPRLRALAEAELTRRGLLAAERGPRALVTDLHPRLDWDGEALRLAYAKDGEFGLDGHPLTLLPTGFTGPHVYTLTDTPAGRALWYAPRGHGRLWDRPVPAEPPAALAALLGPTRAAVLALLAEPSSTGEVAAALRLAPATASHHLTTLRDAGLVTGEREGRRLRYRRTGLGEQLAGETLAL